MKKTAKWWKLSFLYKCKNIKGRRNNNPPTMGCNQSSDTQWAHANENAPMKTVSLNEHLNKMLVYKT